MLTWGAESETLFDPSLKEFQDVDPRYVGIASSWEWRGMHTNRVMDSSDDTSVVTKHRGRGVFITCYLVWKVSADHNPRKRYTGDMKPQPGRTAFNDTPRSFSGRSMICLLGRRDADDVEAVW